MEITSLCLMLSTLIICAATLIIRPNRAQFFKYDQIFLSCVTPANSTGWTVRRNTSTSTSDKCKFGWGIPSESSCFIKSAFPSDTGLYWCESQQGECSDTINITVTDDVMILESPGLPVTEGDNVTLQCSYMEEATYKRTSDFSASFYHNNEFIGFQTPGKLTFLAVSKKKNEGFYKCKHPTKGESPQSWLAVRDRVQPIRASTPPPIMSLHRLVCTILLIIIYNAIVVVCIIVYRRWARARAEAKKSASDNLEME